MSEVCIRAAEPADVPVLLTLIRALAVYEKLEHEVIATEADLRTHLFGVRTYAEALIAECKGEAAGFALYFHKYSTRSEEHTSELPSLMRISYDVFCLNKKQR